MQGILLAGPDAESRAALALDLCKELAASGLKVAAARIATAEACAPAASQAFLDAGVPTACLGPGARSMAWPGQGFLPDLVPLAGAEALVAEAAPDDATGWLPRLALTPEAARDAYPGLGVWGRTVSTPKELARLVLDKGFVLPGLDCGSCGREDCATLAREIAAGTASTGDCAAAGGSMRVKINGSTLGLNLFVERMLAAGLTAMLGQLKGFAPGLLTIEMDV